MSAASVVQTKTDEWRAVLELDFREKPMSDQTRTIVTRHRHVGPLTTQRAFYPEAHGVCHTYLLHPPAGITGSDRLTISARLAGDAKTLITTPGATRFYRSNGQSARLRQILSIDDSSQLEWLPQETLIYARANAKMSNDIHLYGDGQYFGWEVIGLGRPASGEHFTRGQFDLCTQIFRDNALRFRDRMHSEGMPTGLRDNHAFASLYASHADATSLTAAREICRAADCLCAPTLVEDFLIVRALAAQCHPLLRLFRQLWQTLRPSLLGRPAMSPQIWRT